MVWGPEQARSLALYTARPVPIGPGVRV